MQFLKVDENTFQCVVTAEDLQFAGMQVIDIITDKDKSAYRPAGRKRRQ